MKSKIFSILTIVVFATIGFFLIATLELFGRSTEPIQLPIPKKTDWLIRIDANTFWKEELYTILFDSKDEQLLRDLQEILNKKKKGKGKSGPLYINFQSDLVAYGIHRGNNSYTVLMVQLNKPASFKANISNYLQNNQRYLVVGNTGFIISQTTNNKSNPTNLNALLNECAKAPFLELSRLKTTSNELISIKLNPTPQQTTFNQLELGIEYQENAIHFHGQLAVQHALQTVQPFDLKSSGFYISCRAIPSAFKDTLLKYMPFGRSTFSKITGLIIDYRGMYLADEKSGLPAVMGYMPLPMMNMIITSNKPISIDSLYMGCPASIRAAEHTLNFGEKEYSLVQLSPTTLFIGVDPTSIVRKKQTNWFEISGQTSAITTIEGNAFIAAFVQGMAPIKVTNDFFRNTQKVQFIAKQKTDREANLLGVIEFKKGKYPLNEITKLLMKLNVIR